MLDTNEDTDSGRNELSTKKKPTKLILIFHCTMLFFYLSTGITTLAYHDYDCSVDNFLLAWLIFQAVIIIAGTGFDIFMPRKQEGPMWKKVHTICNFLLLLWGVIGIIMYATMYKAKLGAICGKFMWEIMLGWSIVPGFLIFIADIYI